MTNEEKAREIANHNFCDYQYRGNLINTSRAECEVSALEMADWKDAQFKEFKSKVKEFMDKCDFNHLYKCVGWENDLACEICDMLDN